MDGYGKTLYWFGEENLILEVPFFQRPYVWDEDNWKSLINSIESSLDGFMPFIGSFILQEKINKTYWVIDGQQRITTLTLLIKALLDFYTKLQLQIRAKLEDMIYKTEIADVDNVIKTPRLIPAYLDKEDYDFLMSDSIDIGILENKQSNICGCYKYFIDYFSSIDETSLKKFTSKLLTTSKYVIAITLNEKDDEQEIFDTVNSLGKRLTNSDIVKNYLYQQMKNKVKGNVALEKQVMEHYNKYWDKVFYSDNRRDFWDTRISLGRISTTNLDSFLKDFGTIKGIYTPSDSGGFDGIAKQYKEHINDLSYEALLAFSIELSNYAETYYEIKNTYQECNDFRIDNVLNTTLLILDKLEISTFNPYILQLVKKNEPDLKTKLFNLQKFVLKRFLWKASIKNYNKCCLSLLSSQNPNTYLDSYNEQTVDVQWDYFPQGLKTIKNNHATLILFLIEMIRRHEKGEDNYSDTLLYNKSLEHIMPQKWEKNWSTVPSYILNIENMFEEVTDHELLVKNRKSKIYSIGNMTLLASKLNTSISNDCFKCKIEGKKDKGMKVFVGTLSIAQEIVDAYNNNHKWDERDIINRETTLFNELNAYFEFEQEVKQNDYTFQDVSLDASRFTDDYFNNKKIGEMVKESFKYFSKSDILTNEDISNLKSKDYCRANTGCAFPVLVVNLEDTRDSNGRIRYYKDQISINGKNYYLCKEWFEDDRKYIGPWLKNRIK